MKMLLFPDRQKKSIHITKWHGHCTDFYKRNYVNQTVIKNVPIDGKMLLCCDPYLP